MAAFRIDSRTETRRGLSVGNRISFGGVCQSSRDPKLRPVFDAGPSSTKNHTLRSAFSAFLATALLFFVFSGPMSYAGSEIVEFRKSYVLLTVPDTFGVWTIDGEYEFFHAEKHGERFWLLRRADPLRAVHQLPKRLIPFDLEVKEEKECLIGGIEGRKLMLAPKRRPEFQPDRGMVVFHAFHQGASVVFVGKWTDGEGRGMILAILDSLTPTGQRRLGINPKEFKADWKIRREALKARKHARAHFPVLLHEAASAAAAGKGPLLDMFQALLQKKPFSMEDYPEHVERGMAGYADAIVEAAATYDKLRVEAKEINGKLSEKRKAVREMAQKGRELQKDKEDEAKAMALEFLQEEYAAAKKEQDQLEARKAELAKGALPKAEKRWVEFTRCIFTGKRLPNLPPLSQMKASPKAEEKDGKEDGPAEGSLLEFLED